MEKLLFLLLALLGPAGGWAHPLPAPLLPPVDDGVYRFVARNDVEKVRDHFYRAGHVEAYLKASGQKVWEKYLYPVRIGSRKARPIYLKKIYLEKPNRLIVQNEREEWFVLERRTGETLTVGSFTKKEDDPSVYYLQDDRIEPVLEGNYFVVADKNMSYGHQTVRAFDLPTGKLRWKKRVPLPKSGEGGRSRISFMILSKGRLGITFEDGSECILDLETGKILKLGNAN